MKKILIVINSLNIGGPQKSLLGFLDNIDYEKYDIDLYVLQPGGELEKFINKNVNILKVNPIHTALTYPKDRVFMTIKTLFLSRFILSVLYFFKTIIFRKSMKKFRQNNWKNMRKKIPKLEKEYDTAIGILGLSTYFIVDCVKAKVKVHWVRSDIRMLNSDENIDNFYYKKIDLVIAVSNKTAAIFIERYPFIKNKMVIFYNLLPLEFYKRISEDNYTEIDEVSEKIKIIVTIARLDPLKGFDLCLDACELLKEKRNNFKWFVLGDGIERAKIEKEIIARNLQDHFILLGFKLNTFVFLQKSDLLVHASRAEGKSNVIDEAKYLGKPIVVTNYPTVSEQVIDGVNGLVSEFSGKSIFENIEKIFSDKHLAKKISHNNKSEENSNKYFQRTNDLLEKLVNL
ncbi:glycosyltransferase [Enterococcus casseliflavus]|uniref:glycosyltransferase n=1 Tax=Enterococcus casseliflavus TaxID=37734 RepID=UPI003D0F1DC3